MRRFLFVAASMVILFGCQNMMDTPAPTDSEIDTDPSAVKILWDEWGVPHIQAAHEDGAFYGLGWAQMRGRPNLMLKLYGQGRGRAAEYWGDEYTQSDVEMWKLGIPQRLEQMHDAQGPTYAARLDAFVKGVNDYAERNPDRIADEMKQVLPVKAEDVLGHITRSIHLTFVAGSQLPRLDQLAQEPVGSAEAPGSNAWAVGPARSESGHAMLLTNPHLPWDDLYYFFESHIQTPEINSYGVSLIAQPFQILAFNEHLGWTHTVNTYDGADIYEFDLHDDGYVGPDGFAKFDEETVELKIRQADGALKPLAISVKETRSGHVLHENDTTAFAIKIAGLETDNSRITEQYWDMAKARDLGEFERAMARLQMPMLNTVYADKAGNIFYLFNGLLPRRAIGDHTLWAGTLDGANPEHIWNDYLSYEKLPKYTNPESSFIQNANEPPWTSTLPAVLDPADFPSDLIPPRLPSRPQHSLSLLMADGSISFEEMIRYSHSPRLVGAENILDPLIALANMSDNATLIEAAGVLSRWDRQANLESRGAVLFHFWGNEMGRATVYDVPWSFDRPIDPPSGLADPERALAALEAAAEHAHSQFGAMDVPWSAISRVKRDGIDVPVAVAPGVLGGFRVGWISADDHGEYALTGGTTYVAAIEFGDHPSARGILPYGNFASPPPGVKSQWEIFAQDKYRLIRFSDSAVTSGAVLIEPLHTGLD